VAFVSDLQDLINIHELDSPLRSMTAVGHLDKFLSGFSYPRKGPPRFRTEGRMSISKSGLVCVYCV